MLRTIDEVKGLQASHPAIREDARDPGADLEEIAGALRAAAVTGPEPGWFDDLAAGLAGGLLARRLFRRRASISTAGSSRDAAIDDPPRCHPRSPA
jgi:hypothetical protein